MTVKDAIDQKKWFRYPNGLYELVYKVKEGFAYAYQFRPTTSSFRHVVSDISWQLDRETEGEQVDPDSRDLIRALFTKFRSSRSE
jgi:hypothetical protein